MLVVCLDDVGICDSLGASCARMSEAERIESKKAGLISRYDTTRGEQRRSEQAGSVGGRKDGRSKTNNFHSRME